MNKYFAVLPFMAAVWGLSPSVQAHHGPGQFNGGDVVVSGVVTKVAFVNPHGYIYFDAKDAQGNAEPWRCELQAGSLLHRAGWTEDLFPIGGEITVTGSAGTRERTACALESVVLADGSTLGRYEQRTAVVDTPVGSVDRMVNGKLDLNGTWAGLQRRVEAELAAASGAPAGGMGAPAGGPPGGPGGPGARGGAPRLPNGVTALTEAAIASAADIEPGYTPRHHCLATNIFHDWEFDRHVNEIIQTDDTIKMKYGLMDIERTIYLKMDKHPANIVPSIAGHSIGHWEGATLVVDTIGFSRGYLFGTAFHNSEQAHIIERFNYDAATQALTRDYTGTDPVMFTGTFSGKDVVYHSIVPFEPYACVELKDEFIEPI